MKRSIGGTLDSIANAANKISELITNIGKKLRHEDIDNEKIDQTNKEFNDRINNDHDTTICDAIRKKKQQEIEALK